MNKQNNEDLITKDRQDRVGKCKAEIEASLHKYELALGAEDMIGAKTKIIMELSFMDLKQHEPITADKEIISDLINPVGDKIK